MLAVAVCIGGGDVNEGLEVVHLMGQAEELLRGNHIELQGVPMGEHRYELLRVLRVWGRNSCTSVHTLEIKCMR